MENRNTIKELGKNTIMTDTEIENRYNLIDEGYGSEGRNVYECKNFHFTLINHRARGVTPFIIACPECRKKATSWMYRVPNRGAIYHPKGGYRVMPLNLEYYVRPKLEWLLANKDSVYLEHVLQGGLIFESKL